MSERPPDGDAREPPGHWEMDTVVGKQGTKLIVIFSSNCECFFISSC